MRKTKWDGTTKAYETKMNCIEANKISIVSFLQSTGIEPKRISGKNFWYLSPIRNEKTPSFKVDNDLNRWFDHGLGQGGKLVDLAIRILNISVKEFLKTLSQEMPPESFSFHQPIPFKCQSPTIVKVTDLTNVALLRYLERRCIDSSIAKGFCNDVYYSINSKNFFGIGFRNDVGGYEIRNRYFKGCIGPKSISFIKRDADTFTLFEGFIDFLTAIQLHLIDPSSSIIVLNSVNQIYKAIRYLESFSPKRVQAFFDRDQAGKNCFATLQNAFPNAVDRSTLYENFNDLNKAHSDGNKLTHNYICRK